MVIGILIKSVKDIGFPLINELAKSITSRGGEVRFALVADAGEERQDMAAGSCEGRQAVAGDVGEGQLAIATDVGDKRQGMAVGSGEGRQAAAGDVGEGQLAIATDAGEGRQGMAVGSNSGCLEMPLEFRGVCFEDESVLSECDMAISLGGDGTLIRLSKMVFEKGVPFFGINLGNLGYLAEVEVSDIDNMIDRVFNGRYQIENRIMLNAGIRRVHSGDCGSGGNIGDCGNSGDAGDGNSGNMGGNIGDSSDADTGDGNSGNMGGNSDGDSSGGNIGDSGDWVAPVFNDISITRGNLTHSVHINVFVDDSLLEVFSGDGIIVSTPTGSTAYSLSAGGPVVDPVISAILLVPVCPHIVFSRPLVLSPDRSIRICLERETDSANISFDGADSVVLKKGWVLEISRSKHTTKMVKFNHSDFYGRLKNKLFHKD